MLRTTAHAAEFLDENDRLCGDLAAQAAHGYGTLLARVLAGADRKGELALARQHLRPDGAAELLLAAEPDVGRPGRGTRQGTRVQVLDERAEERLLGPRETLRRTVAWLLDHGFVPERRRRALRPHPSLARAY